MPFKFDSAGNIVTTGEGANKQPVFVYADGREAAFDADGTLTTISRLNGEAKNHRERAEAAEDKLKKFDGIEDPEAAKKAIDLAKNIKDGELVTAGKVQEIKDAATKSARESVEAATRAAAEKEKTLTDLNAKLTQDLNNHIIGGSFAGSKFIAEKLAIPPDIAQKVFGDRLKVENGKLVPLDANGNPMFSVVRHGEHANFEEAIEVFVSQYPNKDMILKGSGASGGGARQGGAGAGGKKEISRTQFTALSPADQMTEVKSGTVVVD